MHTDKTFLWRRRRGDAPLCRALEPIRQLDQPRLAARHTGEADAERSRLRIEPVRKPTFRRIRHKPEWNDHSRVTRLRRDGRAARAWEQERVQIIRLHGLVDSVRPG